MTTAMSDPQDYNYRRRTRRPSAGQQVRLWLISRAWHQSRGLPLPPAPQWLSLLGTAALGLVIAGLVIAASILAYAILTSIT